MAKNYWSTVDNGLKVILYSFLIGDETFEENLTSIQEEKWFEAAPENWREPKFFLSTKQVSPTFAPLLVLSWRRKSQVSDVSKADKNNPCLALIPS